MIQRLQLLTAVFAFMESQKSAVGRYFLKEVYFGGFSLRKEGFGVGWKSKSKIYVSQK
jgi:hypothetical protein